MEKTMRKGRALRMVHGRHRHWKQRGIWIGLLLAATSILGEVRADEIVLKNGDRISGKVKTLSEGKLSIETSYAGTLVVDWKEAENLTIETPLDMEMEDGRVLRGQIRKDLQGLPMLLPAGEGKSERVALSRIVKLSTPEPPPSWKTSGRVAAGASKYSGNTNTEGYNMDGQLTLDKSPHLLKFYGEYFWENEEGTLTKDKGMGSGAYERLVTDRLFLFANVMVARDKLKTLEFQASAAFGPGWRVWKSEEKNLSFSVGLSYVYERYSEVSPSFDNRNDRGYGAAFWAVDFDRWFLGKTFQFFHSDKGFYDLQGAGNWQLWTRTGVRLPLWSGLFASLQYNFDFVNIPAEGKSRDDSAYLFKLGWNW